MAEKLPEDKCQQTAEPDKQKSDPPVRPARRQSVVIYLIILFLAAFLLLLMAYFMQQRNSNAIIGNLQDSLSSFQTMEELREENAALQQELQGLKEENAALQEENETLGQQYADASQQAGCRSFPPYCYYTPCSGYHRQKNNQPFRKGERGVTQCVHESHILRRVPSVSPQAFGYEVKPYQCENQRQHDSQCGE